MEEKQYKRLLSDFQKQIEKKLSQLENSFNTKFEYTSRQISTLQTSVDRLDRDTGDDRKEIFDTKLKVGEISNQMTEIRDLFNQQTQKIKETVHDAVQENVDPVSEKVDELKEAITQPEKEV